jgi:hypothetical protein
LFEVFWDRCEMGVQVKIDEGSGNRSMKPADRWVVVMNSGVSDITARVGTRISRITRVWAIGPQLLVTFDSKYRCYSFIFVVDPQASWEVP